MRSNKQIDLYPVRQSQGQLFKKVNQIGNYYGTSQRQIFNSDMNNKDGNIRCVNKNQKIKVLKIKLQNLQQQTKKMDSIFRKVLDTLQQQLHKKQQQNILMKSAIQHDMKDLKESQEDLQLIHKVVEKNNKKIMVDVRPIKHKNNYSNLPVQSINYKFQPKNYIQRNRVQSPLVKKIQISQHYKKYKKQDKNIKNGDKWYSADNLRTSKYQYTQIIKKEPIKQKLNEQDLKFCHKITVKKSKGHIKTKTWNF